MREDKTQKLVKRLQELQKKAYAIEQDLRNNGIDPTVLDELSNSNLLKYELILDNCPDAVLILNEDLHIVYANETALEKLKYSQEKITYKRLDDIFRTDYCPKFIKNIHQTIIDKETRTVLEKCSSSSESKFWIFSRVISIELGVLCMYNEITSEVETHNELIKMESLYEKYIQISPESFFLIDKSGKLLDVNDTTCSLLGYTKDEILHLSVSDIVDQRDKKRLKKDSARIFKENGVLVGNYSFVKKNAESFPITIYAASVTDTTAIGFGRDKIASNEIFNKLYHRENFLKLIEDNIKDVIFMIDDKYKLKYVSPSIKKLLGFPGEEKEVDLFEKCCSQNANAQLKEIFHRQKFHKEQLTGHESFTIEVFHSSGKILWCEVEIKAILGNENEYLGILGLMRDISSSVLMLDEITQLENRYRELYDNLYSGVLLFSWDELQNDFVLKDMNLTSQKYIKKSSDLLLDTKLGELKLDVLPENVIPKIYEVYENNATYEYLFELRKNSKTEAWFLETVYRQSSGEIVFIFYDITEEKRSTNELKNSEEKFRSLIENAPIGILFVDIHGNILNTNSSLADLFEYNTDEIKKISSIMEFKELDGQLTQEDLKSVIRTKRKNFGEINFVSQKTNINKYLRYNISPLNNSEDILAGILITLEDITDIIIDKEKIRHLNAVLKANSNVSHLIFTSRRIDELVNKASKLLIADRGYRNSMIALIDKKTNDINIVTSGVSGFYKKLFLNDKNSQALDYLRKKSKERIITRISSLAELPINNTDSISLDGRLLFYPLYHDEYHFGVISVSIDNFLNDTAEEETLFIGLARDLGYAIHSLENQKTMSITHKALLESERLLSTFFAHSQDGYIFSIVEDPIDISDIEKAIDQIFENQKVTRINNALVELSDFEMEDILSSTPMSFFNNNIERAREIYRSLLQNGENHFISYYNDNYTKKPVWLDVTYIAFWDSNNNYKGNFGIHRDITEQKKYEEKILNSELRFKTLSDLSFEGIVIHKQSEILTSNYTFCKMFEIPEEDFESLDFFTLFESEQREIISQMIETNQLEFFETKMVKRSGDEFSVEMTSRQIDYFGQKASFTSIRDITDKVDAEKVISRNREQLELITDGVPVLIAHINENYKYLYVNHAYSSFYKLPKEKIIGKRIDELQSQETFRISTERFNKALLGETQIYENIIPASDGNKILYIQIVPHIDNDTGDITSCFALIEDVTDTRKRSLEIARLNNVLRSMIHIHQFLFKEVNKQKLLQGICERMVETKGYVSAWIITLDSHNNFDESFFAGNIEHEKLVRELFFDKKKLPPCAGRAFRRDGLFYIDNPMKKCGECPIHVDYGHHPVLSVKLQYNERVYGILAVTLERKITTDNTEFSVFLEVSDNIAFALFTHETREKKRIAEIEKQEIESQLIQSQKLETIGTLAGGIAHDFNNILTPIVGYAELCMLDIDEETLLFDNLQRIKSSAERAKDLVKQILVFSRQTDEEKDYVDISLIVKEALKLLESTIPSNIEIKRKIDRSTGLVFADPTRIHSVIMNLCTNAYQAMKNKENDGILEVSLFAFTPSSEFIEENPDFDVRNYALLRIRDNGMGMNEETKARIFDPFFTTKRVGEGTGLGMAVVHGIVKSYGGQIKIDSEIGNGTTFSIYLPTKKQEAVPERITKKEIKKGTESILFVDDKSEITHLVNQMLSRIGYNIDVFEDSTEALYKFSKKPDKYDIIITDQSMPKLQGTELARKILEVRPEIPIIVLTGYSSKINKDNFRDYGITDLVMKPVVISNLAEVIRNALDYKK